MAAQVKGEYKVWVENMKRYFQNVKNLTSSFLSFDIQQIPKAENVRMDAPSKLAASLPANLQKGTIIKVLKASSLEEPLVVQQVDEESS